MSELIFDLVEKTGSRKAMLASGPSVWTGRALQAESGDLEVMGLALLYPALERNVWVPGHNGYPRAFDLLRLKLCRPVAPRLPIIKSENFGTFSFYGQLSSKLSDLPVWATYSVLELSTSHIGRSFRITFE